VERDNHYTNVAVDCILCKTNRLIMFQPFKTIGLHDNFRKEFKGRFIVQNQKKITIDWRKRLFQRNIIMYDNVPMPVADLEGACGTCAPLKFAKHMLYNVN
jgi:hypothetical protein